MKTAVFTAPREINVQDNPISLPKDDEVLIRFEGCGLCASDMPVWEGREWFGYPMPPGNPGHEGWGVVDTVGKNVKSVKPGNRVSTLCQKAYAEFGISKGSEITELPNFFDDKPFPGEPMACVINIFRRCKIKPGMTTAIVGTGWIGLLLIQLVKTAGAEIIAISRSPSSYEKAKACGADHFFSVTEDEYIAEQIKELTDGQYCDCVIEAAGKQESLDLASQITGIRGRLVIAGYHQDGLRTVNMQQWNWRGLDVINAHERNPEVYLDGMREAVLMVAASVINPFPLFTHKFPLEDIQTAFETFDNKPENFIKALITFE